MPTFTNILMHLSIFLPAHIFFFLIYPSNYVISVSFSPWATVVQLIKKRKKEWMKENEVAQSCLTLCDPMDCRLPGSSVCGIFQARVLEWVAISFSRGSSQLRDQTWVSRIVGRHFTVWATREQNKTLSNTETLYFLLFLSFIHREYFPQWVHNKMFLSCLLIS